MTDRKDEPVTTIKALPGYHISEVAEKAVALVGAGEPSVSFDFNEIVLTVTPGMTAADVCADYDRQSEERSAAYRASPEYKRQQEEAEAHERQRRESLADALSRAPANITLRDPDGWARACAANTDGYGGAVMSYAERWARVMEEMIASGATVAGCAKEASHLADEEGITGFMYGCAVSTLAAVWVHGEALRRWHNLDAQIGNEGERANESGGVLNPALLTVGKD